MQVEPLLIRCHHMNGMLMNSFIVSDGPDASEVTVIDPGDEAERILEAAGQRRISQVILTHRHPDHIGGLNPLVKLTGARALAHELDAAHIINPYLDDEVLGQIPPSNTVDTLLGDGDRIAVGSEELLVIHTPGHSDGSICLYNEKDGILISGDTLFREACGRTDFYSGNTQKMRESLARLATLPDEVMVYPGHDEWTTIGYEKHYGILREFA